MKYTLALLAAAMVVHASPFPQGVTAKVSPKASPPPGCKGTYAAGTFGIAVMNISTAAKSKRQVSTIADGQPQATTGVAPVSTISDGQPQASTGAPVSTISDGQPQAPTGIPVSTISDGQPQAPTSVVMPPPMHTMGHVSQITDGQIQGAMHTMTMMAVSQITDGQIQATMTYMAVTTIVDGQPQAPTMPAVSTIADGQPQAPKSTGAPVSTISDGQPQAPKSTVAPVSTISDGQPQATTAKAPVSTISDGQPQASTGTKVPVSTISDSQPQASTSQAAPAASTMASQMVACKTNSSLEITLKGGVLTDSVGRTGYIASNFQFQFDKPPQAGAIYTAGWSVCANGSLALGGSNVFYQCLSGDFYNLYNEDWAAQCSPVTINSLMLIDCA